MDHFKTEIFPKTRIVINDTCSGGPQIQHVTALLEIDELKSGKYLSCLFYMISIC